MRNHQNLLGNTLNGLEICTILRYEAGQPVYGCKCLKCGSTGIGIPHRLFIQGNAVCTSSTHNNKRAIIVARVPFSQERSQRIPQPVPDPERESREAQRIEAKRQENERVRAEYGRYAAHMAKYSHELESTISFQRWLGIGEQCREQIMKIVERAEKAEQKRTAAN
jgi:hypothetical protein